MELDQASAKEGNLHLLALPQELLLRILGYLDIPDLLPVSRVSHL
jgi:hypothetical protein